VVAGFCLPGIHWMVGISSRRRICIIHRDGDNKFPGYQSRISKPGKKPENRMSILVLIHAIPGTWKKASASSNILDFLFSLLLPV